jgi:hypothetical protein
MLKALLRIIAAILGIILCAASLMAMARAFGADAPTGLDGGSKLAASIGVNCFFLAISFVCLRFALRKTPPAAPPIHKNLP